MKALSDHESFLALLDVVTIVQQLGSISAMTFPDDTTAINTYLTFIMHSFQMRTAFISELSESAMHTLAVTDEAGCGIPVGATVPLHETFCQHVRASGAPVVIPDAANDPRVATVSTRLDFSIGSYIGVPLLLTDGSLYGSLCVLDPDPHEFTVTHVAVVRTVARQLAAIIERATTRSIPSRE